MCFHARVDDKRRHDVISSSTRRMAHIATRLPQFFHPFDFVAHVYRHREHYVHSWLALANFRYVQKQKRKEKEKKGNGTIGLTAFSKELNLKQASLDISLLICNKSRGKLASKIREILPREHLKNFRICCFSRKAGVENQNVFVFSADYLCMWNNLLPGCSITYQCFGACRVRVLIFIHVAEIG